MPVHPHCPAPPRRALRRPCLRMQHLATGGDPVTPYYSDDLVTLYHGDCRDLLPRLGPVDAVVTDPPYSETSLAWDRWPDAWPSLAAAVTSSMWCFGSMRMFLDRRDEFTDWRLSQDLIWRKPLGTSFHADRFIRVHEHVLHFYRGPWGDVHREVPTVKHLGPDRGTRTRGVDRGAHLGAIGDRGYTDNGTRLLQSVIDAPNLRQRSLHPTEKPLAVLDPLIQYTTPRGGGPARPLRRVRLNPRRCTRQRTPSHRDRSR